MQLNNLNDVPELTPTEKYLKYMAWDIKLLKESVIELTNTVKTYMGVMVANQPNTKPTNVRPPQQPSQGYRRQEEVPF